MKRLPRSHPYRRLAENHRDVVRGLTQYERQHKEVIRRGDEAAVEFQRRIHQLMIGLMAESALRKIIANPDGFNDKERGMLLKTSQLERWLMAVELAFRRHYSILLHLNIDSSATSESISQQYTRIRGLLDEELATVISDRNKLAHAQWAWQLNSKENQIVGRTPVTLNYRALERRSKLIVAIASLIDTLVISEPTFQRDYDDLFSEIDKEQAGLSGSDYPELVEQLRKKRRPSPKAPTNPSGSD